MVEGIAVASRPGKPTRGTKTVDETEDRPESDIRTWQEAREVRLSTDPQDPAPEGLEETKPKLASPSLRERATRAVNRAREAPKKASGPRVPRKSIDKLIGAVWGFAAQVLQPLNMPVARVLAVQAPVAGMVLEDALKNTVVDRLLQPLAGLQTGGEIAFALMGPPMLVGALTVKPEMAPILVPLLRRSLATWIDIAGPKLEEVAKQERKFEEQYGTRIDDMIEFFLTPPPDKETETG